MTLQGGGSIRLGLLIIGTKPTTERSILPFCGHSNEGHRYILAVIPSLKTSCTVVIRCGCTSVRLVTSFSFVVCSIVSTASSKEPSNLGPMNCHSGTSNHFHQRPRRLLHSATSSSIMGCCSTQTDNQVQVFWTSTRKESYN